MENYVAILVTSKSFDEAERIARKLIENGLAACVNIVPGIVSIYSWKGSIETENEVLMVIKSSHRLFEQACRLIESEHSYEVPEVISVPVSLLSEKYSMYLGDFFGGSHA